MKFRFYVVKIIFKFNAQFLAQEKFYRFEGVNATKTC